MTGDAAPLLGRLKKHRAMAFLARIKRWHIGLFGLVLLVTSACTATLNDDFEGSETIDRLSLTHSIDGRQMVLSYLRAGDRTGQRVIFVHGTPGSGTAWLSYLEAPPKGYEFIALDRPGFGLTQPRKALVSLKAQAEAIAPFLVKRQGRYPILVGHSLGGAIVAAVAANYPDRVAGMVQVAGSLDPDLEDLLLIQYVGRVPPFSWMIPRDLKNTNLEIFALEDELRNLALRLDKISAPTIILHGTLDDLVPYANLPYMQRTFINARPLETVTLDGQNHFLPWNSAPALKMAIDRIARNFPGPVRPALVIEAEKLSETPGMNPAQSIFNHPTAGL